MEQSHLTRMTADIVSAYAANHRTSPEELSQMITGVGGALSLAANPPPVAESTQPRRKITRRRAGKVVGKGQEAAQESQQESSETNEQGSDEANAQSGAEWTDGQPPAPMFDE